MNAFYRAVALTAALLLAGCSHSTATQETRPQAWLQPGTRVTLPPPGISPAVSYLMSDIAGYVTRQVISINGGML